MSHNGVCNKTGLSMYKTYHAMLQRRRNKKSVTNGQKYKLKAICPLNIFKVLGITKLLSSMGVCMLKLLDRI